MQSEFCKQVLNSYKNTEIKHFEGDKMFIGCNDGFLQEFSINEKKLAQDSDKILYYDIISMCKTSDNKSQFLCDRYGGFKELHISTRKLVNVSDVQWSTSVKDAMSCVVTHDNKFLIVSDGRSFCTLTKQSVRTKKEIHTWSSYKNKAVCSQSCSYDNKYQLIGYYWGWLGIFDLQKHQTLKNIEVQECMILPVAFSRYNQAAFISDYKGNIKQAKWQAGANSRDDFDFSEEHKKVGNGSTVSICLTKDEKYLIVGSFQLVSVFGTMTRKIIREFILIDIVMAVKLIKDGKKAIIVEKNGNLSNLDLETLEISSIDYNIRDKRKFYSIAII